MGLSFAGVLTSFRKAPRLLGGVLPLFAVRGMRRGSGVKTADRT